MSLNAQVGGVIHASDGLSCQVVTRQCWQDNPLPLAGFEPGILLVDDINASAAPDYLGAWRVFQGAQGIANLHFIHLLDDQCYLLT